VFQRRSHLQCVLSRRVISLPSEFLWALGIRAAQPEQLRLLPSAQPHLQ
jgi:hypothetical protein